MEIKVANIWLPSEKVVADVKEYYHWLLKNHIASLREIKIVFKQALSPKSAIGQKNS